MTVEVIVICYLLDTANRTVSNLNYTKLTTLKEGFKTILEKEENAGGQYFLLFPQCLENFMIPVAAYLLSANAFNMDTAKNVSTVKG